jgi:16S rRNA (guanine966-N2)-methyltransferase
VRETLFNWLMLWIPGKRTLDLFAGTGALGFEALSRGARSCHFVERSPRVAEQLRANMKTLDATTATLEVGDARAAIAELPSGSIDLVFLDPPFADASIAELCCRLNESGILAAGARVYIEAPRDSAETELPVGWAWIKSATAGTVRYGLVQT